MNLWEAIVWTWHVAFYFPMKTKKCIPQSLNVTCLSGIRCYIITCLVLYFYSLKMYKREITSRLRDMFLRHRTYHTTSWCHRVAFAWPPGVLLAKNSHLRVAFVWSFGDTRCLHDGYPRASRSHVAFLTQSVNFVCPSCVLRVVPVYGSGDIV